MPPTLDPPSSEQRHTPIWQLALACIVPLVLGRVVHGAHSWLSGSIAIGLQGLALFAFYHLYRAGRDWLAERSARGARWLGRFEGAFPVVVILVICAVLLWPLPIGEMITSKDHPVHMTRAWHFFTHNLSNFRLSGWSDIWFAGWPSGEDYPPAGDWLISATYLLTFGLGGWQVAYALGFFTVFALVSVCAYYFGRVYFGRVAGLIAAVLFMLDPGAYREGGWDYTVYWGVWPQVFSTGFSFAAFAALDAVIRRGKPRDYALCGAAAAGALLSHPMAVLVFAMGAPIYIVVRALADREHAGRVIVRTGAALGLGGALAAFWVIPFASKSAWAAKYCDLWKPLDEMAGNIWAGNLFGGMTPLILWLGLLGAAIGVAKRNVAATFLAALLAALLLLASKTVFMELDLISISASFGQILYQRFTIPAKFAVFLLAGHALVHMFRAIAPGTRTFSWRRYVVVALLVMSAAPFIGALSDNWVERYGKKLGGLHTTKEVEHLEDYKAFLAWSDALRADEDTFYRIAYVRPYNDHYFANAPVYNHTPALKIGFTPCTTYKHKPDKADADLYTSLNVKYVVSIGPTGGRNLKPVQQFGAIRVYEYTAYTPQRYTLEGPGKVEVVRFAPEEDGMTLQLSGTDESSRLILHVGNYANWRATLDGEPLAIETAAIGQHEMFISVPARDGLIEFAYVTPAANMLGGLVSWLAILLLVLFLVMRLRPQVADTIVGRLGPWWGKLERHGVTLALAVLVLGLALLAVKLVRAGSDSENGFMTRISEAKVEMQAGDQPPTACELVNDDRIQCEKDKAWNYVGKTLDRVGDEMRHCIWAHPADKKVLRITFPDTELGAALVGHHGLTDSAVSTFRGGAPVKLDVLVDGQLLGSFERKNRKGWEEWRVDTSDMEGSSADVTFEVSTTRAGGRHYCFDGGVER